MFELGARPHPPRELYRAYPAQSDIFVGLYWQRYGWVGAGMEISGLDDELELARALPRLLYVKAPAPDREPRLAALLTRIKEEAAVSYRSFHPCGAGPAGARRPGDAAERGVRRRTPWGGSRGAGREGCGARQREFLKAIRSLVAVIRVRRRGRNRQSARKASTGSIRKARRTGTSVAMSATTVMSNAAPPNAVGSVGLT